MNSLKNDKTRLIACLMGKFHLLKPEERDKNGNIIWHDYGKRKSIKGIYDLLHRDSHRYKIYAVCEKTKESLRKYEETLEQKAQ